MRLPGIQYGSVPSLGRRDVSSASRKFDEENRANLAWAKVMNTGALVASNFASLTEELSEKEGKRQEEASMLTYKEEMNDNILNMAPTNVGDDGKEIGVWEDGKERFNKMEMTARENASKNMTSDRGLEYFNTSADAQRIMYGNKYATNAKAFGRKNDIRTNRATVQQYLDEGDFSKARTSLEGSSHLYTANDLHAQSVNIGILEINKEYNNNIDTGGSAQDTNNLKDEILIDDRISDAFKNKYMKKISHNQINDRRSFVRDRVVELSKKVGIAEAVVEVDKIIVGFASITDSETDAMDPATRQSSIRAMKEVIGTFKAKVVVQKAANKKLVSGMNASKHLPTSAANSPANKAYDNQAAIMLGGDFENNQPATNAEILANDTEGLQHRTALGTLAVTSGYVSKPMVLAIDAGLTSNDAPSVNNAVSMYQTLSAQKPSATNNIKNPAVDEHRDALEYFQGQDAANAIVFKNSLKPAEMKSFVANLNEYKSSKDYADNIEKIVDSSFLQEKGFFQDFNSLTPSQMTELEATAKAMLPYSKGNIDASYKAAATIMSRNYSFDPNTGNLHKNAMQKTVVGGDVDEGKWMGKEIKEEIGVETYGYDRLPDTTGGGQQFLINYIDEETGIVKATVWTPDFEGTDVGKKYKREQQEKLAHIQREKELAIEDQILLQGGTDAALGVGVAGRVYGVGVMTNLVRQMSVKAGQSARDTLNAKADKNKRAGRRGSR